MNRRSFITALFTTPLLTTLAPNLSTYNHPDQSVTIDHNKLTAAGGTNHRLRQMVYRFNQKAGIHSRQSVEKTYTTIRHYWHDNPAYYAEMARKGYCHPNPETQLQLCWNMDVKDGFV